MQQYQVARANMILGQVRTNDVQDQAVIEAMGALPRERFVPATSAHLAYADVCVPVSPNRFLLDPRTLAKLAQVAAIKRKDRILDIAPATGYSTALLATLADDVTAVEPDSALADSATKTLHGLGLRDRVSVHTGPLTTGCPEAAPFDLVFVNGAVTDIPEAWMQQLNPGGRIVGVVMHGATGRARLYVKEGVRFAGRDVFDATVPLLPGFFRAQAFAF